MAGPRLQGQQTTVVLTVDGEIVEEFQVQNATFTPMVEVSSERYLGDDTNSYDESFTGFEFSLEGHASGSGARGVFAVQDAIVRRARKQTGAPAKINITFFAAFPSGDFKGYTLLDCKFASPSINATGTEFVTFSFSGNSSDYATL